MKRVTGIGGIFIKPRSASQADMLEFYRDRLGIELQWDNGISFDWSNDMQGRDGQTIWSVFSKDSDYFEPGSASFMVNYRVADLDALMLELEKEGVKIDPKRDNSEYGKFAWVYDPDGNKLELWEPPSTD
ncbi:MAG: VOC family protein [Gammaproteobacteria bacterium]|nr:VOC family protein [Gammaproteobacteria bacterium]NNC96936.1 VOC family protein [Gammaproteobacteria bacterium]NNM13351.1 VOC family protein [Gammaproteobacteria bacterium]